MAITTHGSLAAEAAAYIAGSGDILPRSRGDSVEIRRQAKLLSKWAQGCGRLIVYTPIKDAPQSGGAEHEVFFHQKDNRVFKRTHPGTFGSILTSVGVRRTATPYFYLCRLELLNQVFGSNLLLEGVTNGDKTSIVSSQPWVHPADTKNPLPSQAEIRDFMTDLQFESVPHYPIEWFRKSDNIRVSDAREDNFIKTTDGVVPIDLIICKIDPPTN